MRLAAATSAPAALLLAAVLACAPARTRAADTPGGDVPAADAPAQTFAVHGQFTYTEQSTSDFNAPYAGPNSLTPDTGAETVDATLFLGRRLWRGAEIWVSPEIDQGFGLDDTLGVAAFPSGEAYKMGKNQPYLRLQRAFVRQTLNLGDSAKQWNPDALQLGGTRSPESAGIHGGQVQRPRRIRRQPVCARSPKRLFELGRGRCRHLRLCRGFLGVHGRRGGRVVPASVGAAIRRLRLVRHAE